MQWNFFEAREVFNSFVEKFVENPLKESVSHAKHRA